MQLCKQKCHNKQIPLMCLATSAAGARLLRAPAVADSVQHNKFMAAQRSALIFRSIKVSLETGGTVDGGPRCERSKRAE